MSKNNIGKQNKVKEDVYDKNNIKIILILMIKNESEIIERALKSVEDFVDGICISDTGSTDNTVEIVKKYFKTIKKPTKICNHIWENFGHNRSLSFNETVKFCSENKWNLRKTYGLLLDADQKLVISDSFDKESLEDSGYNLMIKNDYYIYYVPKLINLSKKWKCIGSTHEYWTDEDDSELFDFDDEIYIKDIGDGGCKSDKYERDIRLLMNDLTKEISERTNKKITEETEIFKNLHKNNARTIYYLGQSYYDIEKWEDAIKWLSKRLEFKDNEDEEYQARIKIGIALSELDKPEEEIKQCFMKSIDMFPYMLEPIYYLMQYYMDKEQYDKAFEVGKLGLNIKMDEDILFFTEPSIYNYKFKDDMLTICIENEKYGIGVRLGAELLKEKLYEKEEKKRIKENYNFCLEKLIMKDSYNDIKDIEKNRIEK